MERHFDLVVVGTGVTSAVATRCREAGWSVAVIDYRPFGGTCALRGCVPKKILVTATEAVHAARDLVGHGVRAPEITLAWRDLIGFKRSMVDLTPRRTEEAWSRIGVEQFHDRARFVGPTTLAVAADRLVGRHVLIAAGAMPAPLHFAGAERLTTSEQFMNLEELPPRLVFVGGGYISFEFAHVAARAGAEVTIVHRAGRPLEGFDPDLVDLLVKRSRELGIKVELGIDVAGVDTSATGLVVRGVGRGGERRFEADMAVHGAGRVPEIDDLDLEIAGVKRDRRGILVDQFLQSISNPALHAGGDAAANGPQATPEADHDALVLTENLLQGNHRTPNYEGFASSVFTVPPLASTGLSEAAARARGSKVRVNFQETSGWFNTRRVGETVSGCKVLAEKETGRVLGAHLLGPHADEVINLFAVAVRLGLRADNLKEALYAYPTYGSDIRFML